MIETKESKKVPLIDPNDLQADVSDSNSKQSNDSSEERQSVVNTAYIMKKKAEQGSQDVAQPDKAAKEATQKVANGADVIKAATLGHIDEKEEIESGHSEHEKTLRKSKITFQTITQSEVSEPKED